MKKIIFLSLIALLIGISIFNVDANSSTFPLIGKLIVLDAGHGGIDSGAIKGEIKEKDINLSIVYKLKNELEQLGASVILTRKDDKDLSNSNALYRKKSDFDNRIKIINNSHADMYLSIHMNTYHDEKYYGPQVFYYPILPENINIATVIQKELNLFTKTNRTVKKTTNTYMYNKWNIKGVLVECGFISNSIERSNLTNNNYQKDLVKTIVNAIIKYFS